MRAPKFSRIADVAVYDWPGSNPDAPTLLFCHATGMHARVWDRIIQSLPEHRAISLDLPGHGRAPKPEPPTRWLRFGEAVCDFLRTATDLPAVVGIGHSMGGHSVTAAAADMPHRFSGLFLIDPVIRPPDAYAGPWSQGHYAAKRRNQWNSSDEMFERFRSRPPFDRWDVQTLRDYCDHALDAEPVNGHHVLACVPAFEASIYEASSVPATRIHDRIARLDLPVRILLAPGGIPDGSVDLSLSPTDPEVAKYFRRSDSQVWSDCSHFIPMEQPQRVAASIQDFIQSRILQATGSAHPSLP